ncbi:uncharacterized protein [Montipora capricornis]|uniref:uncharacterized protein n=1 Tax=Montipora capricornis TaxID=246305 RepID=UPI0035F1EE9D
MDGPTRWPGKYSILVNGGHANVGHRARMSFHRRQRRGYCTSSTRAHATSKIIGPDQKLKYIPPSILNEVVMSLNNQSPLGNDWRELAGMMLIPHETIMNLDHHGPEGRMDGVLRVMHHRKVTVGDFVQMLQTIQRPDVIEIFTKAGYEGAASCSVQNEENNPETDAFISTHGAEADLSEEVTEKMFDPENDGQTDYFTNASRDSPRCMEDAKSDIDKEMTIPNERWEYGATHKELAAAREVGASETSNGFQTSEDNTNSTDFIVFDDMCRLH